MKKYDFLVYHKQYDLFLEQLRELGVLHVAEKPESIADSESLRGKMQAEAHIAKVVKDAQAFLPEGTEAHAASGEPRVELVADFDDMQAERQRLVQAVQQTEAEEKRMEVWGDFSPERLQQLRDAGFVLQYFTCPASRFDAAWETDFNAFPIGQEGANLFFVTVNREPVSLDAEPVKLNERSSAQLSTDVQNLNGLLVAQQGKMEAWTIANLKNLEQVKNAANQDIDWTRVNLSTEHADDDTVMVLEGYCPEDNTAALNAKLDELGIYYEENNPEPDDQNIPIKLKNNFFARLFEPITNLYSLPNYSELDLTAMFAPFFMLFFGLCMGDAGYGLLILVAAIVVRILKPNLKNWANLGIFLGAATVFAGLLTGTFFGIQPDSDYASIWPDSMKRLFLTQANYGEQLGYDPMMVLAVGLGVVQIFFAMFLKGVKITRQHGLKYAASTFAWLVVLIDLIIMAAGWMGAAYPQPLWYVLYAIAGLCALIILFYNTPGKNPLINFGSGLYGTYNMASGLLGDVLSYIRLFALGLAGGILGNVFNQLALQLGHAMPSWIGWLPCILVLLFGHGLNLFLCVISAVVHPMRLTFVEFYKNAEFEGGGRTYHPFAKVG